MTLRANGWVLFMGLVGWGGIGCGGGSGVPAATPERESGQSGLMNDTFAGKNKCNPKNAERPFVVEWDATDMSSFEAFATNDVVIVRYEGCELRVLDHCRDDSVRGKLGAYRPVEWTTGQLETVDISNEGELYAKLPLGAASLGGRVQGGEKFHMEYYVAGTRNASRTDVYRAELDQLSGCKGATHWVYGYNLGAFALGSVKDTSVEVGGSLYGFGAGANKKSHRAADKKGGDLGVCKSDVAAEVSGCKSPVRLILREVQTGADPSAEAAKAPDTNESLNAAGQIAAKLEMSEEARAHFTAATEKWNAGDGKGCLKELDAHDKLDPKNKSTDAKGGLGNIRAMCLMQSGQCDAGKKMMRKVQESMAQKDTDPAQIDHAVEGIAANYCQGANMSQRDQLLKALHTLAYSSYKKVDLATCKSSYDTATRLKSVVKPRDENDSEVVNAARMLSVHGPQCFERAGDCATAYKLSVVENPITGEEKLDAETRNKLRLEQFESLHRSCKGKVKP
jgi:hypothetical protein